MTDAATALAEALAALPQLGVWVEDAACADLGLEASAVFTSHKPDPDGLEHAEAVCWRGPVQVECADYAAQVPVWDLWGATWHDGKARPRQAA